MDDYNQKLMALLEENREKVRYAGPKNPIVKELTNLIDNEKPNPKRLFVLEGIWAFTMAFRAKLAILDFILCPECVYSLEAYQLAEKAILTCERVHVVSLKVLSRFSERDKPDGLVGICRFPQADLSTVNIDNAIISVIDGVEIPGNVGTILRSCDGAAVDALFIVNRRARLTHPKVIKGSMGAAFFIPVVVFETVAECRHWLSEHGFTVYLADTRASKTYRDYAYEGNVALVSGSERYGISREWYEGDPALLSIPMLGKCDSLNVAIATTIILYEMRMNKQT